MIRPRLAGFEVTGDSEECQSEKDGIGNVDEHEITVADVLEPSPTLEVQEVPRTPAKQAGYRRETEIDQPLSAGAGTQLPPADD